MTYRDLMNGAIAAVCEDASSAGVEDYQTRAPFLLATFVTQYAKLDDIDFSQHCAVLIQKHYGEVPTDVDEHRRMIASLSRYGYSIGEIREAIRLLREQK